MVQVTSISRWIWAFVTPAVVAAVLASAAASAAAPKAVFHACGPEAFAGFECGSVAAPLDRMRPSAGSITIEFQLFRHWDSAGPATGTIVTSVGGPGYSNTAFSPVWLLRVPPPPHHPAPPLPH